MLSCASSRQVHWLESSWWGGGPEIALTRRGYDCAGGADRIHIRSMKSQVKRPGRRGPIPAALATTCQVAVVGGEIRTIERPLVDQLAPTDHLRLGLVSSDPDVADALAHLEAANKERHKALLLAAKSPEYAEAHSAAVRVQQALHNDVLVPAILKAEERRRILQAVAPPDQAAMAAAAKRPLDLDTRVALERVLRRRPLAKDESLWQIRTMGAARYLLAAVHHEVKRIRAERDGEVMASGGDLAVYDFVEARPRKAQRAPEWWAALLRKWNVEHPGAAFSGIRGFQAAFRRGRQAATELPYDEARAAAALETRVADRQAAREILEELVASAGLTPKMRATLEAIQRGEDHPRWALQDLVNKLRKAAAKKF